MELYLLHRLYEWQIRRGDFRGLEELTERIATVAKQVADPLANAIANAVSATTRFYTGDHREVQEHADIAIAAPVPLSRLNPHLFDYSFHLASNGHPWLKEPPTAVALSRAEER